MCNENIKQNDVVLASIFCFSYLKVNDTKDRMLTDTFEFSTLKKQVEKQFALKCRAQFNVSYFSPS